MSTYHGERGESGQRAAENTKGAFKEGRDAIESVRKNINSYADTLVSGESKSTPHKDHDTTHIKHHGSTGIHPDAKRAGDEVVKGAGAAAGKIEGFVHRHQKKG